MPKFNCKECGAELVARKPINQYHAIDEDRGSVSIIPLKANGMDYIAECSINEDHKCGFYFENNKIREWTEEELREEIKKRG